MTPDQLNVGDRIWITGVAGNGRPGYYLHAETRSVYRKIVARHRPVRISRILDGMPWFSCRFRRKDGTIDYHFLAVADGDDNWRPVRRRRHRRDK